MDLWLSALLGAVQGLTEFVPVSSTAHLRILPALIGEQDAGTAYSAVIQLGTVAAVLVYFSKDLFSMARAVVSRDDKQEAKLALCLVVGTIPIAVVGILAKPYIVGDLRSLYVVATALIIFAVVMGLADLWSKKRLAIESFTIRHAVIIGAAQALALVPGVSRSGATIAAALLLGYRREDAARISFLLAIPAIGGAGLYELPEAMYLLGSDALPALAVGAAVAAITGYASIAWLLRYLRSHSLLGFAGYRVALGLALLGLLFAGTLSAQ